jgi:hypothetical protein
VFDKLSKSVLRLLREVESNADHLSSDVAKVFEFVFVNLGYPSFSTTERTLRRTLRTPSAL